jgi:hypothetical protein
MLLSELPLARIFFGVIFSIGVRHRASNLRIGITTKLSRGCTPNPTRPQYNSLIAC